MPPSSFRSRRSAETHCPECARPFAPIKDLTNPARRTRDHIFPQEWGGDNHAWFRNLQIRNIRTVCAQCNQLRAVCNHCVGAMAAVRAVSGYSKPRNDATALQWFRKMVRPNKTELRRIIFGSDFAKDGRAKENAPKELEAWVEGFARL